MVSGTAAVGDEVELISMWVAPSARGQGIGDALIDALTAYAIEHGAGRVLLAVRETNRQAIALYQRHGFVDAGLIEDQAGGSEPERRMVRMIRTG